MIWDLFFDEQNFIELNFDRVVDFRIVYFSYILEVDVEDIYIYGLCKQLSVFKCGRILFRVPFTIYFVCVIFIGVRRFFCLVRREFLCGEYCWVLL